MKRRRERNYLIHLRNMAAVAAEISRGTEPVAWQLAADLGVTERTIHRYIRTLRDFGAPLPLAPGKGFRFTRRWNFEKALVRWLKESHP
jgi:predicted DNA-binding transcriptional regulator YafY